jgi:hypothetical protein
MFIKLITGKSTKRLPGKRAKIHEFYGNDHKITREENRIYPM